MVRQYYSVFVFHDFSKQPNCLLWTSLYFLFILNLRLHWPITGQSKSGLVERRKNNTVELRIALPRVQKLSWDAQESCVGYPRLGKRRETLFKRKNMELSCVIIPCTVVFTRSRFGCENAARITPVIVGMKKKKDRTRSCRHNCVNSRGPDLAICRESRHKVGLPPLHPLPAPARNTQMREKLGLRSCKVTSQGATTVVSDSPGLVDFPVGQAEFSGQCPTGEPDWSFSWRVYCWVNSGLVRNSYTTTQVQARIVIFVESFSHRNAWGVTCDGRAKLKRSLLQSLAAEAEKTRNHGLPQVREG